MVDIFGPGTGNTANGDPIGGVSPPPALVTNPNGTDTGFDPCDANGQGGTRISTGWLNRVTYNLRQLVRTSGAAEDNTSKVMAAEAAARIASGGISFVDSGAADAYVLASPLLFVAPKAYFQRQLFRWTPANTNTGPSTAEVFSLGVSLGVKKILLWDGAELAGGELLQNRPTVQFYDPAADGGNGALVLPPWASAVTIGTKGDIFNVTQIEDGVRTVLSGTGAQQYISHSYTKRSATSDLYVLFSGYTFVSSTGPSWARIDVGGTEKTGASSNNTSSNARGATVLQGLFTGLAAGAVIIDIDYGREDANSWSAVVNPQTSDKAQLRNGIVSVLVVAEIEQ